MFNAKSGPKKTHIRLDMGFNLVRKAGLEPARLLRHQPLKLACLPIPPLPQNRLY